MKSFILLTLLSFEVLALDPQGGNGGNICYFNPIRNACWDLRSACYNMEGYRVLDEYQYNYLASHEELVYGKSPLIKIEQSPIYSGVYQTDLTATKAGKSVLKKLKEISNYNWWLSNTLVDIFQILKGSYISNRRFLMAKGASLSKWSICSKETLEAAILTDDEGMTVISEEAWNLLPLESQKVLLIHETLRLAQTHATWFKQVSNEDLQMLTMALYAPATGLVLRHPFYSKFIKFYSHPEDRVSAKISNEDILNAIKAGNLKEAAHKSFVKGEREEIGTNKFPISKSFLRLQNNIEFRTLSEKKNLIFLDRSH